MRKVLIALIACLLVPLCAIAQETLQQGDRGDAVKAMQSRLVQLHYLAGSADGIFGAETRAALEAFQAAGGLAVTGAADQATRDALDADDAPAAPVTLGRGDRGEMVEALQQALILYGFLDGRADGAYGTGTQRAVTALQEHMKAQGHDVEKTGKADPALRALITGGTYNPYLETIVPGDKGGAVVTLQKRLSQLNYMDEDWDGDFGAYTTDALCAFQKAAELDPTGAADRRTYAALYKNDAPVAAHPVPRTLRRGDTGRGVRAVQKKLMELGVMTGLADDQYGAGMSDAVRRLNEHLALFPEVSWAAMITDPDELRSEVQSHLLDEALPVYVKDVQSGDKGAQALRVQRRLHALYYIGRPGVDGKFGENSTAAVKRFQQLNGLEQTGIADERTQALLFSGDAVHDQTPYLLEISLDDQMVYAYELGEGGEYTKVRSMKCSTGLPSTPTPRGIFRKTLPQDRWHYFKKFVCWAQYTYIIDGDIMFHSVLYSARNERTLRTSSVYNLGDPASHGCVRLSVEDAKWIFENCVSGTIVLVD